jgi:hypothetical protein
MKKSLFYLICLQFSYCLPAQPTIQWQKALGGSANDEASSIQATSDGGYVVAGKTLSSNGDVTQNHGLFDFWIVKLDHTGAVKWEKTFGGSHYDWPYAIRQTQDGGFIVAGYTRSTDGDVSGNHGDRDAWVIKLSSLGTLEWQKALGGSSWDEAWSIEQTTDGGYIMAGRSSSNDGDVSGNHNGSLDFWVVKLSETGIIQWQRSLGGSNEDTAHSIKQTTDGGYVVVGDTQSFDGDISGNNGDVDFWVVKLSGLGDIEWQNSLGGTGLDVASDVQETIDGYIACGYVGSHNTGDVTGHQGSFDYWVVKLTKNGELDWQKTLGGTDADWGRSIVQTMDGKYVIVGETRSSDGDVSGNNGIQVIWTVKLSEIGEIIWKKTMGGTEGEGGQSLQQTSDEGFIIGGFSFSNNGDVSGNHGNGDFWVVKLSPESVATHETHNTQTSRLEIFPNPAWQSFTVHTSSEDAMLHVTVSDLLGREVLHETIQNGGNLSASSLPNGLYLVVAKDQSGRVFTGTLRKES